MRCQNAILIVVEEDNLRRSLALLLKRSGYEVDSASYLEEAVFKLQSGSFDLALIDTKVNSRISGDLVSRISQSWPDLPLLILVPSPPGVFVQVDHQRVEYMVKPIDPTQLLAQLRFSLIASASNQDRD